jgi:ABC-type iron transport system FetAB permease component
LRSNISAITMDSTMSLLAQAGDGISRSPTLSWTNVLIGLLFIAFDSILSLILGLGIGGSLVVASLRCVLQLTVMGLVLDKAFASQNVWSVVGIARE